MSESDTIHIALRGDDDDWEVFKANHMRLMRCDCGCGTLQMLGCDENDEVHAVIAHTPEQWLDICRAVAAECIAMTKGEEPQEEVIGKLH